MGVVDEVRGPTVGFSCHKKRPFHGPPVWVLEGNGCLVTRKSSIKDPRCQYSLDTLSYRATRVLEAMLTRREEAIFPE